MSEKTGNRNNNLGNNITTRAYETDDFAKILDFIQQNYRKNGIGYSWNIDRFNFTYSVSRILNEVSMTDWEASYMIVEENGEIIAVVNTEGEDRGESFIQVDRDQYDEAVIKAMFDFLENNHRITRDEKTFVNLRLKHDHKQLVDEAMKRGFNKLDWGEPDSMIDLEGEQSFEYHLPKGFSIITGKDIKAEANAIGHGKAFGYFERKDIMKLAVGAFEAMVKTPSYREEFDIAVINETEDIVAFATVWYDDLNQIGILEPVGTHADYRRLGLAKAAIYEGIQRIMKLGAKKIYVGSDQDFYKAIGFKEVDRHDVYTKQYI